MTNAPGTFDPASQDDSPLARDTPLGRQRVPAWLMSIVLHCLVILLLAMTIRGVSKGLAVEPDRPGGIVLAQRSNNQTQYFDQAAQAAAASATSQNSPAPLPSVQEVPLDLAGALPPMDDGAPLGSGIGDALPTAGDLTGGVGTSRHIDGGVQTQVFGASAYGSKFVYVFDRSASMDGYGGRPLAAAKSQLIASLRDLDRIHQFQIVFYNERPHVFNPTGGTPTLVWGDERGKTLADRFVRGIVASGSTRHMEALQLALRMRPDAIFFLTDADEPRLTPAELAKLRSQNEGIGATINTIEFGFGPSGASNNFLVQLARENNGQHVYVDVSRLGAP